MTERRNKYILALLMVLICGLVLIAAWQQSVVFDFMLLAAGILGGLFASYFLFLHFNTEHTVLLNDGEEILHDASECNSHIMIRRVGEKTPQTVVKSDLFFTNIGIVAEDPMTRELILYIPLDMIVNADIEGKSLKVDFTDESSGQLTQVLLHIGRDFDGWAQSLYQYLSNRDNPQAIQ